MTRVCTAHGLKRDSIGISNVPRHGRTSGGKWTVKVREVGGSLAV